jgi:two-component system response regulator HydG
MASSSFSIQLAHPKVPTAGRIEDSGQWEEQGTRERVDRTRLWQGMGVAVAMGYALAVLVASWTSPDLGFWQLQGSAVLAVHPESAAARAGLERHDRIVAVNGQPTPDALTRAHALWNAQSGETLTLRVERAGRPLSISYQTERHVPVESAAGLMLATFLLVLALLADRGDTRRVRNFFFSTLVYVVFTAGIFSLEAIVAYRLLTIPFLIATALTGPVTCHNMIKFPAGPEALRRRQLAWLYGPPLVLSLVMVADDLAFAGGHLFPGHPQSVVFLTVLYGACAAVYLAVGGVVRFRRLREKREQIDRAARAWLRVNVILMVVPLLCGLIFACIDPIGFATGGFEPVAAAAMVGGALTMVMAMTRVPFGQLDAVWRGSSGYVLVTGIAAGLYLAVIGLLGGAASMMGGGDVRVALGATLAAAVMFGPVRVRVQRWVDRRFGRDRARVRYLLREAAEEAATTLDIDALQKGVAERVRAALYAVHVSIYVAPIQRFWRREALAGEAALPDAIPAEHACARAFTAACARRAALELPGVGVAVPIPVADGDPAVLVVELRRGHRFGEEELDLLSTVCANLVVAIGNARARRVLSELNQRLHSEVKLAEERRLEIARLKERVDEENRALIGQLAARNGRAPLISAGLAGTFELVQKVARTDSSVLVRGETGVGKELVARAVHAGSARRDGPFVVLDCGAITPSLFESALFGHVRGAFTGAVRDAQGAFRSAHGGTIFLDEIGELPAELQPKLLRVLEERRVQPVGGEEAVTIDVRVIAGTNRDLAAEVGRGAFRQDLLYRLQVVEIEVPALRERRGDIEPFAAHFLARIAEQSGRPMKQLGEDAVACLLEYDWPGNVRELEHTLEAAAVYSEGLEIRAVDLPIFELLFQQRAKRALVGCGSRPGDNGGPPRAGLRQALEDLERTRLLEILSEHGNNKTRAARALGMSRGALLRRLKRYELL